VLLPLTLELPLPQRPLLQKRLIINTSVG